ncbi:MAG: hypothetical protein BGO31_09780 [Bacteroidetes bacterium 43-16]|nr:MAG: hypothetical protein BGO31_09780 [Bacteroidetes bacterium 43-16]
MKQHFTKLAISFLLMICSTCLNAQSKLSPGEKFLEYYNAHDVKNLNALLADNFVIKFRFKDKSITKKELLGGYMNYNATFNVGYSTIAVIVSGNPEIISVKEYSDQFKLLDVNPSGLNFLIESKAGKITSILMDTARGANAYFKELAGKETAFRNWVKQKYSTDTLKALDKKVTLHYDLMSAYALKDGNAEVVPVKEVIAEVEDIQGAAYVFRMPCTHFAKLSLKQRLALYPFNKAKSVMLVSFTDATILYPDYNRNKKSILALGNTENKKVLAPADIDKLSDLLFNIGYDTEDIFKTQVPECPELKNAIIFLDDKGKPFDYIGVYFGCNAREYDINKIGFPVDCDDKYNMLSEFFSAHGIQVAD